MESETAIVIIRKSRSLGKSPCTHFFGGILTAASSKKPAADRGRISKPQVRVINGNHCRRRRRKKWKWMVGDINALASQPIDNRPDLVISPCRRSHFPLPFTDARMPQYLGHFDSNVSSRECNQSRVIVARHASAERASEQGGEERLNIGTNK